MRRLILVLLMVNLLGGMVITQTGCPTKPEDAEQAPQEGEEEDGVVLPPKDEDPQE